MKIEGYVQLVFRDVKTKEITKIVTKSNNVTNYWIEQALITDTVSLAFNGGKFGPSIFISEYDQITSFDKDLHHMVDVVGIGNIEGGVTSPILVQSTISTFPYGVHQQRFQPSVSSLTIRIVGFTDTTVLPANGQLANVQTYLVLGTPITQTTTETLDVFYRIQIPYDHFLEPLPPNTNPVGLNATQTDIIADRLVLSTGTEYFTETIPIYNSNVDFSQFKTIRSAGAPDSNTLLDSTYVQSSDVNLHKLTLDLDVTIDKATGLVIGALTFGRATLAGENVFMRSLVDEIPEVVQNIFAHSAVATKPFFDPTTIPSTTGSITINGDSWTNPNFPKLYRINITGTGIVGVSTYQFQVRTHFGFHLNSYLDHFRIVNGVADRNRHLLDDFVYAIDREITTTPEIYDKPMIIPYDVVVNQKNILAVRRDALNILNLKTEIGPTFNSTNFPTFTPTDTSQVTFESTGEIYVACRASGLYKIADPLGSPAVSKIDNTTTGLTVLATSNCYGVVVGNGRLWSIWDGGLFYSTNNGVSWTQSNFTNGTITADWTLVKCIQADPTHVDHRLAIIYDAGGTQMGLTIMWWSETGSPLGTDVQGPAVFGLNRTTANIIGHHAMYADQPWTYFTKILSSPTQNKWGGMLGTGARNTHTATVYPSFLTFATITVNQTLTFSTAVVNVFWELDSTGDYNLLYTFNATDDLLVLVKDDLTTTTHVMLEELAQGDSFTVVRGIVSYLGNLIFLAYNHTNKYYYIFTAGSILANATVNDFTHILYDTYGWTGAAWELDNVGSKTTHAAAEVLNDGITVAFNSVGSPLETFDDTDYFTCGLVNGIWLDGNTRFKYKSGLYFKNIIVDQIGLESSTLPATIKSPEIFETRKTGTWQDEANVTTTVDNIRNSVIEATYSSGARSVEPAIVAPGITNKSTTDLIHGRFIFRLYSVFSGTDRKLTAGLSPISVIGNAISRSSPHFAFEILGLGTAVSPSGNGNMVQVNILEQGGTVATDVATFDTMSISQHWIEIEMLNDGTVNYYLLSNDTTPEALSTIDPNIRKLVYATSQGTAPIVDYYIDLAINGPANTVGLDFGDTDRGITHRIAEDYYLIMGDFSSSPQDGRYVSNFFALDYSQNIEILIAGTPATQITPNDTTTVLAAGEVSVFKEGFVRYSASDTGKTVSATYNVLTFD